MRFPDLLPYRRWRNKLIKQGLSEVGPIGDESFKTDIPKANTALLEKQENYFEAKVRLEMKELNPRLKDPTLRRLVQELAEIYKKEKIFRIKRVEEIKKQIQQNTYHISGKAVVDHWFSEDVEN